MRVGLQTATCSTTWCVYLICIRGLFILPHRQNNEDLPNKPPPPTHHLLNDSILAMGATSETSSAAIVSIFHCLLANPEAYAALQGEVDRFYPPGSDARDIMHHRDMHYLTAVMYVFARILFSRGSLTHARSDMKPSASCHPSQRAPHARSPTTPQRSCSAQYTFYLKNR